MVRRGMMVFVGAAWLAACGSSAPPLGISPNDGGGTAGTNAAGTGASGTGAAGAPGTGAAGAPLTCGGNLLGEWAGSNPHAHPPQPPADPCYQLRVFPQPDGTFGASTRWPAPERREARLNFAADHFSWQIIDRGPVTIAYAASCLAKTIPRPTCTQLAGALLLSGQGEGSVFKVDCTTEADAGCTCTLSISEIGGPVGDWSAAGGIVKLLANPGAQEKRVEASFCTDGSTLRFGAEIDALGIGLSGMTFERFDCNDGKQGAIEDGVDCGYYCSKDCP